MRNDTKQIVIEKKPTRQKIIVGQGRNIMTPFVPYKILYTEIVSDLETAKKRVIELKEEYKDTDALSVSYFSL